MIVKGYGDSFMNDDNVQELESDVITKLNILKILNCAFENDFYGV